MLSGASVIVATCCCMRSRGAYVLSIIKLALSITSILSYIYTPLTRSLNKHAEVGPKKSPRLPSQIRTYVGTYLPVGYRGEESDNRQQDTRAAGRLISKLNLGKAKIEIIIFPPSN